MHISPRLAWRAWSATLACALLTCAPVAHSTVIAASGKVVGMLSYANFGGGDFTFKLASQPAGCSGGFWLSKSQPGFQASVAFILKAHTTGEQVLVGADNAQLWTGSGDQWCKVDYVGVPY